MWFDGMKFRRTKKVFPLPYNQFEGEHKNYIAVGRACAKDTEGAIRTDWNWKGWSPFEDKPEADGRLPIYVIKIEAKYHSLTNLMLGKDGNFYLMYDGVVYISGKAEIKKMMERKKAREVNAGGDR